MKVFLILALAVFSTSAALTSNFVAEKWENFKFFHNKSYLNFREESFRKQIFQKNLQQIEKHNVKFQQKQVSYTLGVNQFADMTSEEMKPYTHGLIKPNKLPTPNKIIKSREDLGVENVQRPDSFDWRSQGVVTPVKNQGGCGSCWAFSSTGAIESQEKIAYGANFEVSVSEQQLVDCTIGNLGCTGGWMATAFQYVANIGGIDSEQAYPYEAVDGTCRYRNDAVAARIGGYVSIGSADEGLLADMVVNKGPIAVAFDASGDFGYYSGGVYYNPNCDPNSFTHAVLVVGYGNENGQDYWLVKNSWGADWGLDGYFKIARNRGNHCGIATMASVPYL